MLSNFELKTGRTIFPVHHLKQSGIYIYLTKNCEVCFELPWIE